MKIAVYTIAKNEVAFIRRWSESAKDADVLLVADTGSTDDTAEEARAVGAMVIDAKVDPWRFDTARNTSLDAIPSDVDLCIALDADEVLMPGWRAALESMPRGITRPRYRYVWNWEPDGTPGKTYGGDKIHARHGFRWKHPVHEVLRCHGHERQQWVDGLEIHHHADNSKPRSQYLPLLELSVKEDPEDDRNAHYYGRELIFNGRLEDAAKELMRHLSLAKARWPAERAASMRYLAQCQPTQAYQWILRAIAEDPTRRESHMALAQLEYERKRWPQCYAACLSALAITERQMDYTTNHADWSWKPHDLAAISAYHLGLFPAALMHGIETARMKPSDKRLEANLEFYDLATRSL